MEVMQVKIAPIYSRGQKRGSSVEVDPLFVEVGGSSVEVEFSLKGKIGPKKVKSVEVVEVETLPITIR